MEVIKDELHYYLIVQCVSKSSSCSESVQSVYVQSVLLSLDKNLNLTYCIYILGKVAVIIILFMHTQPLQQVLFITLFPINFIVTSVVPYCHPQHSKM